MFDEAFKRASDCSILLDEDFAILRVSDSFLAASGFFKADILGSSILEAAPDETSSRGLKRLLRGLKAGGGSKAVELVFRARNKRDFPCTVFLICLPESSKQEHCFLGLIRSHRVRDADARIVTDAPSLRRVVEGIVDPILITNDETRIILECNRGFSVLMGWERAELIGQTAAKLFDTDRSFVEFRAASRARNGISDVDLGVWKLRRRNGSIVSCSIAMLNIFRRSDEIPAAMYILFNRNKDEAMARTLAKIAKDNMILARELWATVSSSIDARESGPQTAGLSRRQTEIVALVAQGFSSKEIAAKLELSETTIRNHLSILFRKFNVSSRMALMNALRAKGVLPG